MDQIGVVSTDPTRTVAVQRRRVVREESARVRLEAPGLARIE